MYIEGLQVTISKIYHAPLKIDFVLQNSAYSDEMPPYEFIVRVYAVIISKYAMKIVGTQKGQVACVHGTQDRKQSSFNTFNPAQ